MADEVFRFCDELGPAKIVHIYNSAIGLKAIVVIDNVAAGPAIGGVRMAPDVSIDECFRLARAMTLKNAAAGLPHGGGKSVIFGNPAMPETEKEQTIRAFACAIRDLVEYIPGPDMGTNETAMAWVKEEIGRSVGLPREVGGIPLDEIGATGFGLAVAAEVAQDYCDVKLEGARVVIQGFGAVGKHAARFLAERGAVLVGASDSHATISNPNGINVDDLIAHKDGGQSISKYSPGRKLDVDGVLSIPCDIWIPAARPDVIRRDNVDQLDCKLVIQGANIAATKEAESILNERGILSIPDFIANAGGTICAAIEYNGGTQSAALQAIDEKVRRNTHEVLRSVQSEKLLPREAGRRLAELRVRKAMALGRWK